MVSFALNPSIVCESDTSDLYHAMFKRSPGHTHTFPRCATNTGNASLGEKMQPQTNALKNKETD